MFSIEEKLLYSLSSIKEILETLEIDVEVTLTKNDNKYTINAYEEIERCVVECINNTQPYEFEDLKVGMWVYDSRLKTCFLIKEINNNYEWPIVVYRNHLEDELDGLKFEKNRFFPVQMANVGCE
ncbi:MAG: hypothetical protein KHY88_00330 [Erysipelotrichaceae bacterium]|nr:hypothetical protein [Erysipelotrichaceae bacterium]